jgi:ATP-binding cassette subfamily C (CFTR/MRP) protein 1
LSKWADKNSEIPVEEKENHKAKDVSYYLTVYAILGMIELVLKLGNDLNYFFRCAQASKVVHKNLLNNVLRSPMKFFDTNPTGRIVNRFTSDLDTMDQMIPFELLDFTWCLVECIATVLLISVTTPPFIGIIIPLMGIYFFIQRIYITSSRQLKRLYSISKSPIFSHFTETTNGAPTIRAYKQQKRFIQNSQDKVSVNVTSIYLNLMSNRWLGTILENLGNFIIFFAALFAVVAKDSLSAGQAGLSITSSLQIIG